MRKQLANLAIAVGMAFTACQSKEKPKADSVAAKPTDTIKPLAHPTAPAGVTGHLLGVWYDEGLKTEQGQQIAYEIISYNGKVFIQPIAFAGKKLQVSDMPEINPESAVELKKSKGIYINVNEPNEIYKVDKKGNLLIYDKTGLIASFKKVM
ncbi:hypothetical protein [Mucilaginibacter sp. CSA2-8R]|uniref:hypothetical protein n=1 Tax=Mucilaginibacter sp. CSA2-8R TaxID=3141542 RepID=UPI00315DEA46